MNQPEDWTGRYFTPMYSKVYQGPLYHKEATGQETAFLAANLESHRDGIILDIGAGFGRHARVLMTKGFRIAGVDRFPHFLKEWPKRGRMAVAGDMRALPFLPNTFSALYCIFNTFGYFEHAQNMAMLKDWARVLRPGGKLILQTPNRPVMAAIVSEFPPVTMTSGDLAIAEQYSYDAKQKTMIGQGTWDWKEQRQEWRFALRLYTHREMEQALSRAGFTLRASYGDFESNEFDPGESAEMVFVAEKK